MLASVGGAVNVGLGLCWEGVGAVVNEAGLRKVAQPGNSSIEHVGFG